MKIIPLAFDSFGVRSMATFVSTHDLNVLIDPGAALGPSRYGLPPHPLEWKKLDECWKVIEDYVKKADVLIVTHYHYDHYDPEAPEIYKNKIALLKHPTLKINKSQTQRAAHFLEQLEEIPRELQYSDGKEFTFKKTTIRFSPAVPHGANDRLGYVTEVFIDDGKNTFLHTSDVEGPPLDDQTNFILKMKPQTLIIDGPMTYMLGYRYSWDSLNASIRNLIKIIEKTQVKTVVTDHHFLRDLRWREKIKDVFAAADKSKVKLQSAAEFADKKEELLEARRNELFQKFKGVKAPQVKRGLEE